MHRLRTIAVIIILISLTANPALADTVYTDVSPSGGAEWLDGYDYRLAFVIDGALIGSDLTQFPVALFITNASGLSDADVTAIFDTVGDSYENIAVTSSDGTTILNTEVECWSSADEQALLWVAPSLVTSGDNVFYLYFGDSPPTNDHIGWTGTAAAEAVWDSSYVGVWHMADNPDNVDQILDSTSNDNTGTKNGGMAAASWEDVGMGQTFDGSNDYIGIGTFGSVQGSATIEGNVFSNIEYTSTECIWLIHYASSSVVYRLSFKNSDVRCHYYDALTARSINTPCSALQNHDVVVKFDAGAAATLFLDDAPHTGTLNDYLADIPDKPLYFGAWAANYPLNGNISEVRISNIARSDDWIGATHLSNTDALVTWDATIYEYVRIVDTPDDQAYIPWEIYAALLAATVAFFILSLVLTASAKFTCIISTVMFFMMSALSWAVEFHGMKTVVLNETEMYIIPYSYVVSAPYLAAILVAFGLGGIMNCYYLWIIRAKEIADSVPLDNRRY